MSEAQQYYESWQFALNECDRLGKENEQLRAQLSLAQAVVEAARDYCEHNSDEHERLTYGLLAGAIAAYDADTGPSGRGPRLRARLRKQLAERDQRIASLEAELARAREIEFGHGTVRIATARDHDGGPDDHRHLVIYAAEKSPIGTEHPEAVGQSVTSLPVRAQWTFTRAESVDVLIEKLFLIRAALSAPEGQEQSESCVCNRPGCKGTCAYEPAPAGDVTVAPHITEMRATVLQSQSDQIAALRAEVERMKEERRLFTTKISTSNGANVKLAGELLVAERERDEARRQLADGKHESDELIRERDKLFNEASSTKVQLAERDQRIASLEAELARVHKALNAGNDEYPSDIASIRMKELHEAEESEANLQAQLSASGERVKVLEEVNQILFGSLRCIVFEGLTSDRAYLKPTSKLYEELKQANSLVDAFAILAEKERTTKQIMELHDETMSALKGTSK